MDATGRTGRTGHSGSGFVFSSRSLDVLAGVTPPLRQVATQALEISRIDFAVISGRRNRAQQRALVEAGKSLTMQSRHLTGEALDVVALDPASGRADWSRAGLMEVAIAFHEAASRLGIRIAWGGSWRHFEDCPHIELRR